MNNDEKIIQILTQIQGDVSYLKNDVSELKNDVSELKHDVSKLKNDVFKLQGDVSDLKQGQDRLEAGQERIDERLDLLEVDHGEKLTALLDGYKSLYDISAVIRSDVEFIKGTQDKHDMQIRIIESDKLKAL